MARNWYAEAIGIIEQHQNWREMIVTIAKKHPKIIVDAVPKQPLSWQDQCRSLKAGGELIKAVKLCRELTGMGLKDALEACKAL